MCLVAIESLMKISYLIPLYNKKDFIEEAIDSVMKEAEDGLEIEICIVDDGSTDGSPEIVGKMEEQPNSSVILHRFPENRGKVAAVNKAFTMATGDFIFILGADDVVVPGRTSAMLSAARKTGKSICGEMVSRAHPLMPDMRRYTVVEPSLEKVAMNNYYSGGCMALWRADAEAVLPVPERLKFEDWWISYQLVKRNRLATIHDVVLIYRIHGGNDCGADSISEDQIARDMGRHDDYIAEFEKGAETEEERRYLRRSRALRQAFFGQGKWTELSQKPFDGSTVRLALLLCGGPSLYVRALRIKVRLNELFRALSTRP